MDTLDSLDSYMQDFLKRGGGGGGGGDHLTPPTYHETASIPIQCFDSKNIHLWKNSRCYRTDAATVVTLLLYYNTWADFKGGGGFSKGGRGKSPVPPPLYVFLLTCFHIIPPLKRSGIPKHANSHSLGVRLMIDISLVKAHSHRMTINASCIYYT